MFLLLFTRGRRVGTPNQSREQGSDSSDSGSTVPNPPAWVFTGAEAANYRQLRLETAVPSLKQTRSAQFPGKRGSREVARQNASTPGRQWRVARTGGKSESHTVLEPTCAPIKTQNRSRTAVAVKYLLYSACRMLESANCRSRRTDSFR